MWIMFWYQNDIKLISLFELLAKSTKAFVLSYFFDLAKELIAQIRYSNNHTKASSSPGILRINSCFSKLQKCTKNKLYCKIPQIKPISAGGGLHCKVILLYSQKGYLMFPRLFYWFSSPEYFDERFGEVLIFQGFYRFSYA